MKTYVVIGPGCWLVCASGTTNIRIICKCRSEADAITISRRLNDESVITLNPKLFEAIEREVEKLNKRLKDNPTQREIALNTQPTTVSELVEEVLTSLYFPRTITTTYDET